MRTVKFIIPGQPVAWKRVVHWQGVTYDPKENTTYKKLIRDYAFSAGIHGEPHQGPVEIELICHLQRPKRLMRRKDPEEAIICISKPDCDNLIKIIKDALNNVAYRDDGQVWHEDVKKYYHEKSGSPRTEVTLIFQD